MPIGCDQNMIIGPQQSVMHKFLNHLDARVGLQGICCYASHNFAAACLVYARAAKSVERYGTIEKYGVSLHGMSASAPRSNSSFSFSQSIGAGTSAAIDRESNRSNASRLDRLRRSSRSATASRMIEATLCFNAAASSSSAAY